MDIELCHLGDDCASGIIIDDIIYQHKKLLFMLGEYHFNDIYNYLHNNHLEDIYNKDKLIIVKNGVKHKDYNFLFNHDYYINNSVINNYDFIKLRFDEKIKNFRNILSSDTTCIFITFTKNIDKLNIKNMIEWLTIHKKKFHLMIFTNNDYTNDYNHTNLSIIKLTNSYLEWYGFSKPVKEKLYKEIYDKFIERLQVVGIDNNFPKDYNDTYKTSRV